MVLPLFTNASSSSRYKRHAPPIFTPGSAPLWHCLRIVSASNRRTVIASCTVTRSGNPARIFCFSWSVACVAFGGFSMTRSKYPESGQMSTTKPQSGQEKIDPLLSYFVKATVDVAEVGERIKEIRLSLKNTDGK